MRQNQSLLIFSALSILFCSQVLGQEVKIEASPGLYVTTLQTPKGNIKAYLPDGLAAGDAISGTVIMEPAGGTEKEKSRNRNELSGYFIELEKEKIPLTQTRLKWTIPSTLTGGATFLVLRDRNGNELSRAVVPVRVNTAMIQQRMNASPGEYHCPMVGRAGTPIQIQGPFDGNFDNTNLSIGGKKAGLIAESPRKLLAENPTDVVGLTQIELKEGPVILRRNFNSLRVVKIGEEVTTFPIPGQLIKAETEREATNLLTEQTRVLTKQKEIKLESETGGILRREEMPSAYYYKEPTRVETTKGEANQKNVALAPKVQKTPAPIAEGAAFEPAMIKEKQPSLSAPQQQIKLDDAKKEFKEEVQVKQNPVLPRQLKEQLEPRTTSINEQNPILVDTDEKKNTVAEKGEAIKENLSVAIKLEEKPSIAKQKRKAENGKTEKGESHKEDFFSEQTPFPTKNIIAKTVPKARVIEKHASTSHFTRGLTEGGSKKKETISNDIAAVAPIESDGRYTIQVASYNSEDDAKDFAEELKSRGYPAFITQGGVPGRGTWYRVRVGKFKTVREARLFAYGLKGQEREIQSFLITEIN